MSTLFTKTRTQGIRKAAQVFAFVMIVSILMPTAFLSPIQASAQEATVDGNSSGSSESAAPAAPETPAAPAETPDGSSDSAASTEMSRTSENEGNGGNGGGNDTMSPTNDNLPPVITILGPNPMTVLLGEVYHELGVSVSDDHDDLNNHWNVSGSVDTNTIGSYSIVYSVEDSGNLRDEETRIVNVVGEGSDNLAPSITILGPNPMTVLLGEVYHELGVTVTDDRDDLNNSWAFSGTVDTSTIGSYPIVYTVADRDGLRDEETRIVNVVAQGSDNLPPVITILGPNPMTVLLGEVYHELGATASDDRDDLTGRVTPTGTVDVNTVGDYIITYTVTDNDRASDTKTRLVRVIGEDNGGTPPNNGNNETRRSSGGGSRKKVKTDGQVLGDAIAPQESCAYLTDYMHRDWQNSSFEVVKLQSFLKYFEGFTDLQPTGIFDQATFDAVSTFQERYKGDILAPWGHDSATGFVYILTKKKINEIYCQQAFPVTAPQAEEIANYRAFLANLKAQGVSVPSSNVLDNSSDGTESPLKDIKDIVGSVYPTSTPTITLSNSMDNRFSSDSVKAAAAAIFSLPHDRGMIFQSLYFLLIALIAIYLLTEIIVGSMSTNALSKYQVWARKATGYLIGLIIAIIVAVWYKIFSIVMPLLILAIISGAFLAWAITRRSGDKVISLPPTENK